MHVDAATALKNAICSLRAKLRAYDRVTSMFHWYWLPSQTQTQVTLITYQSLGGLQQAIGANPDRVKIAFAMTDSSADAIIYPYMITKLPIDFGDQTPFGVEFPAAGAGGIPTQHYKMYTIEEYGQWVPNEWYYDANLFGPSDILWVYEEMKR